MQIQSIYSPNFVQKNSLATKANANSVAQNNPQYSISTLDALAFKGNYYHYKPTADDKKCMYLLDNVYENRFSDIEKRDIMFAIKNMETDGQKSKFLSRILACTDKEGEYLDILDIERGINALSGESLATQNAVSSLYSWSAPYGLYTTGASLLDDILENDDPSFVMEQVANMDAKLKKAKVPEYKRGQILGDTLFVMQNNMRKYSPISDVLLNSFSNPSKAIKIHNNYWEIFSEYNSTEEIKKILETL